MDKIITISREFGAGGHTIGKRVAQGLGIEFYDRDIVRETAKASGFDPELIENEGEDVSRTDSILKTICSASSLQFHDTQEVIHDVQQAIIVQLGKKGPCVILGRCADEILREAGVKPRNILELDRLVTLYSFVRQGTAASIVSDTLVQYLDASGDEVVFYRLRSAHARRELYLSYKRYRYYSRPMEAFAEVFRDFSKK